MRSASAAVAGTAIRLAERSRVPDPVVAAGVRHLLRARLASMARTEAAPTLPGPAARPIAVSTDAANQQHYEVPTEFFRLVLGPHLKYSCCQWSGVARTLAEAERRMIDLTIGRAALGPGQRVLDLGCGWGSICLDAAATFADSTFVAVSNSRSQIEFIRSEAARRGLRNLEARRVDVNDLDPDERFDRIISVEMMEHVRNHAELLRRVAGWLRPESGRLFVHVFCHRAHEYRFESEGPGDWMARRFFTGGMMPSHATIPIAARAAGLRPDRSWTVSGSEYARTAQAWLDNLDRNRADLERILTDAGEPDAALALGRWRLFFLAVRETFGFAGGKEWQVAHYRFRAGAS